MDYKKALLFLFIGFGIALTGTLVFAKKQSDPFLHPTIMCMPTGSSGNDYNAEQNCDYIYGKLEYLQRMLERNTSYITNIHRDLEQHSGINTPLDVK